MEFIRGGTPGIKSFQRSLRLSLERSLETLKEGIFDLKRIIYEREINMNNSRYLKLCTKAVSGEISPEEKNDLERLIKISPENEILYNKIKKTWELTEAQSSPPLPDIEEEWSTVEKSLNAATAKKRNKGDTPLFKRIANNLTTLVEPRYRPAVLSAAAVLIFAAAFLIWRNQSSEPYFQKVLTHNKQRTQVNLPDGSVVHLNCSSSIKFPKKFSNNLRQVTLSGEAFFEVRHDRKPFVVTTENAKVTVLGTKFNVRAWNEQTCVIVKTGRVKLGAIKLNDKNVVLSKGQMSRITGNVPPQPPQNVDVNHLLGWLEGKIVFEKTPLTEIIAELERDYDVSIELGNLRLSQKTLTATFENLPIETVLSSICLTLNSHYKFDGKKYIIMD